MPFYHPDLAIWLGGALCLAGFAAAGFLFLLLRRERRAHRLAVRERESLFRAIMAQSSDAVMVLDADGRFVSINPKMLDLLGYSRSEMNSLHVGLILAGDGSKNRQEYAVFHECMQRLRFHREPAERLLRRNGDVVSAEMRYYYLHDGSVLASVRPPRGEEPSRLAAVPVSLLRELLDLAPGAALVADRQGRVTEFNATGEQLFGWARAEVLGRNVSMLFADRDEAARLHGRAFAAETKEETMLRRKNGETFRAALHARPVSGAGGEAAGWGGFVREIMAMDTTGDQLQMAEQRYWNIVANATDGVFRSTPEGTWTDANPALLAMLGYRSPEELLSADWPQAVFGTAAVPRSFVPSRLGDGEPWVFDAALRTKAGRILPVRVMARAVMNERGKVAFVEGLVRPTGVGAQVLPAAAPAAVSSLRH